MRKSAQVATILRPPASQDGISWDGPSSAHLPLTLDLDGSLHLMNEAFRAGFHNAPVSLWADPGILFLWLGGIRLLSQRGDLDDDPVAFAIKDRVSICLGAGLAIALAAASFGGDIL